MKMFSPGEDGEYPVGKSVKYELNGKIVKVNDDRSYSELTEFTLSGRELFAFDNKSLNGNNSKKDNYEDVKLIITLLYNKYVAPDAPRENR
jgi:hypothetical protein